MPHHPRTILITGASSGIGRATADLFAAKQWNVAASMRSPNESPHGLSGSNVITPRIDVTDSEAITAGVEETLQHFGRIDVLFNNAGYGLNGPIEGATEEQMRRQFDVNVLGVVRMSKAVLPHMRRAGEGTIVTTSSIGGLIGMPFAPLYIASKHALEGLMESARFELKPFGIRLKLIEPGGIKTDFISRSAEWTCHPDYADHIQSAKAMAQSLNERLAPAADVAKVVYRAANDTSDRLRYLAKPGPYVTMYNLLPDSIWRGMIQMALRRQARSGRRP